MKRHQTIAAVRPVASTQGDANLSDLHAAGGPQEPLMDMTRGELAFCLRDVHRYWSTPHISPREMEYLQSREFIQRAPTGLCAIRLTDQGEQVKNGNHAGRSESSKGNIARS